MSSTSNIAVLSLTENSNTPQVPGWRDTEGFTFDVSNDFSPKLVNGAYDYSGYAKYLEQLAINLPAINTLRLFVNDYTLNDSLKSAHWKAFVEAAAAAGFQLIITFADGEVSQPGTPTADLENRIPEIVEGWSQVLEWIDNTPAVNNAVYGYELLNEPEAFPRDAAGAAWYVDTIDQIYASTALWGDKKILIGGLGASSLFAPMDQSLTFADGSTGNGLDRIRDIVGEDALIWSFHAYSKWAITSEASGYIDFFQERLAPILGDNILLTEFSTEREHLMDYSASSGEPQHYAFMHALEWLVEQGIGLAYWSATDTPDGAEILKPVTFSPAANATAYTLMHHDAVARLMNLWLVGSDLANATTPQTVTADATTGYAIGGTGNDTLTGNNTDTEFVLDMLDLETMAPSTVLTVFNSVLGTSMTNKNQITEAVLQQFNAAYGEPTNWGVFRGFFERFGPLANETLDKLYGGLGNDSINGMAGVDYLFGGEGDDVLLGGTGNDQLFGGAGKDFSYGGDGDDFIEGGAGDDQIYGGAGNDVIIGGAGGIHTQKLYGGAGDDIFAFAGGESGRIMDFQLGTDKMDVSRWGLETFEEISIVNRPNTPGEIFVQRLSPTGSVLEQVRVFIGIGMTAADMTAENFAIPLGLHLIGDTGTSPNERIDGGNGRDTIEGLTGNDELHGRLGSDLIFGGLGEDTLTGGSGNDTLHGDAGSVARQQLFGGGGADVFVFASGDGGRIRDFVIGEDRIDLSAWGIYGLSDLNIINYYRGSAPGVPTGEIDVRKFVNGTRTEWIRVSLDSTDLDASDVVAGMFIFTPANNVTGTATAETLTGTASVDLILGLDGNDTLIGLEGGDTLDGGAGIDSMIGGLGNDTYLVDATTDVVVETSAAGSDVVISSATYTLSSNVEALTLTGTAAINGTGNADANVITGNSGANTLNGGAGNDSLYGGAGADYLIGDTGVDLMAGGAGNDIYVVENASDTTVEAAGEGIDLVQSSLTWTLATNVENLTLTGAAAINGTGNSLANFLTGNSAANSLMGGDGNDTLNGGAGADTMAGGLGNDLFYVNMTSDLVIEAENEGVDTVSSSASYTLSANVENLTMVGSSAVNATGNSAGNVLNGNIAANVLSGLSGNDVLIGGGGNDTLIGGSGGDQFVFTSTSSGVDTISDFFDELNDGDLLRFDGLLVGSFVYRGTAAFTGGSDNTEARVAGNQVLVDTNGDGMADITITLTGLTSATQLAASDFLFA